MESSQTPQSLLEAMQTLRKDVRSNADELSSAWHPIIERASFQSSASNLASYLALRHHDLRELQHSLMRWGLSSLGRSESRVQATLDAVIAALSAIANVDLASRPPFPDEESFFQGSQTIASEADLLFGGINQGRETRIMVTLPTEAAQERPLIKGLLRAGIECVRINCAHDDTKIWAAM